MVLSLQHRVKVFVYRYSGRDLHYLMLKHPPQWEGFWGPVAGPIQPWENLERAVLREVREETGIREPKQLLDLKQPDRLQLGEIELVEWVYGYRAAEDQPEIRLAEGLEGFRWDPFDQAFQSMEMDEDRNAMLKLHMRLSS